MKIIKSLIIILFGSSKTLNATVLKALYLARFSNWCKQNPVIVDKERKDMHIRVMERIGADEVIQYLEYGVFQGQSIRWWSENMKNPESEFIGFDTFEGLPEEWKGEKPKGHFTTGGQIPNINDPRCSFQVGLFQDTMVDFFSRVSTHKRKVIHMDADLFSSTLYVLSILAPMIRPGDILIFDEFHVYLDEFRAMESTFSLYPEEYSVIAANPGFNNIGYARVAIEY